MTTGVAAVGIILLMALSVGIGASLDTGGRRVAAREVARGRRERNDELRALREERTKLRDERMAWAAERRRRPR